MKLKILGSSSSGNCYILETPTGSLLLECGFPWRQIQQGLNFDLSSVQGCLVTHSHKDHCKAVKEVTFAGIDCYMSVGTVKTFESLNTHRIRPVIAGLQFDIGPLFTVMPFDTEHDCDQPLGYLIRYSVTGEKLLFLTDSYYCKYKFTILNYIMIECNYIKDILDTNIKAGLIDERMKRRLLESHFSLEHVKEFLKANDLSQCRQIVLLHLSEGNSNASRMIQEIQELTGINTLVAEPELDIELEMYPY